MVRQGFITLNSRGYPQFNSTIPRPIYSKNWTRGNRGTLFYNHPYYMYHIIALFGFMLKFTNIILVWLMVHYHTWRKLVQLKSDDVTYQWYVVWGLIHVAWTYARVFVQSHSTKHRDKKYIYFKNECGNLPITHISNVSYSSNCSNISMNRWIDYIWKRHNVRAKHVPGLLGSLWVPELKVRLKHAQRCMHSKTFLKCLPPVIFMLFSCLPLNET